MPIFTGPLKPFIIKPATNLPDPEPPIRNGLEVYSDEFIFALGTKYVPINDLYWYDKYVKQALDTIEAKVRLNFSVLIPARHSRGYGKSWMTPDTSTINLFRCEKCNKDFCVAGFHTSTMSWVCPYCESSSICFSEEFAEYVGTNHHYGRTK